jgi:uncharacterized membrane protein YgdD (TMEM256/DUF423 family)
MSSYLRLSLSLTALCVLIAGVGVGLQAALAHMSHFTEQALRSLNFALTVQQYHVLVVMGLGALNYVSRERLLERWILIIQALFIVGISLFSGTIFLKYLASFSALSFLTMYGGLILIGTWGFMSLLVLTKCIKGEAH